MALKDILVHADATEQGERRLQAAVALARKHQAHLTALFVVDVVFPYYAADGSGMYIDWAGLQSAMESLKERAQAAAARARAIFEQLLSREDVRGEWRCVEGPTADTLALHALYADLCILGQESPADPAGMSASGSALERVLFTSGRPVLIIPRARSFEQIGHSILLGWKATREAARAVQDALPLLEQARQATVLAVNPDRGPLGEGALPAADIALHLARHGVEVASAHVASHAGDEGKALLDHAAQIGADLLVLGGYGHSRLREVVLGGVTRTVLQTMPLPVLLSH